MMQAATEHGRSPWLVSVSGGRRKHTASRGAMGPRCLQCNNRRRSTHCEDVNRLAVSTAASIAFHPLLQRDGLPELNPPALSSSLWGYCQRGVKSEKGDRKLNMFGEAFLGSLTNPYLS